MPSKHSLLILAFGSLIPQLASSVVLAAWDVDGIELDADGASGIDGNSTSSPYTFSAGSKDSNLQSAELTLSGTVNSSTTASQYGFKISSSDSQTSLAGAITEGHYFQFELVASSGFRINLDSIEMFGESSNTGADNVAILSSVDGFSSSSAIASLGSFLDNTTGDFDTDSSGFGSPIDLSAGKFQGLSSVSFRLYGWNSSGSTGVTYLRDLSGNDLIVNGSVNAIPEPSATMAGCLLALGLCHRKRRASPF